MVSLLPSPRELKESWRVMALAVFGPSHAEGSGSWGTIAAEAWLRPLADSDLLRQWAMLGMQHWWVRVQGVQRAGGFQPPSPPGSTPSPAAFITAHTAMCLVQTQAACGGHGAFPAEALEELSLVHQLLAKEEPVCRLGAGWRRMVVLLNHWNLPAALLPCQNRGGPGTWRCSS